MQPIRRYKGIIIGATGAVGIQLVIELLKSEKWSEVLTLTRRDYDLPTNCGVDSQKEMNSGRLVKKVVDFESLSSEEESLRGYDYMFSCLGTTRKAAGSAEAFMHIDHDFNVNAAKTAKAAGLSHYGLLSASNAKEDSWFLYPQCKGLIECHVKELKFTSLSIFQPGLLNRGDMSRWSESLFLWIASSTPVAVVAHAMRMKAEMELESSETGVRCHSISTKEINSM